MSLAVVRCPACRGDSRVALEALGQMVSCPRCQSPFVAEEDIPIIQPVVRGNAVRPPAAPAVPLAPPRRRRRPPIEDEPEPDTLPTTAAPAVPDPEHDPHTRPVAGLPVSVLVGLALLPFGIPLLWRVTPFLTGQEAALSLAVPLALAIAASALCLGVVYTIDWTATTRIKGVLMLVSLAYLSAAGLFFLKKDLMDRVRAIGGDPNQWSNVSLQGGNCRAKMPGQTWTADKEQPLPDVTMTEVRRARFVPDDDEGPRYDYWFAVSKEGQVANKPDDAWFERIGENLKGAGGKPDGPPTRINHRGQPDAPGCQWTFELAETGATRIVRVFVINNRVYYLCAEGPRLKTDYADYGEPFFGTFSVLLNQ